MAQIKVSKCRLGGEAAAAHSDGWITIESEFSLAPLI